MQQPTFSALAATSGIKLNGMVEYKKEFAPTIKEDQPEMEITSIPEKSSENGVDEHQQAILNTYDKIGKFDLKKLEVEVLESGLPTLDKHKTFTKNQGRLITVGAHTSHGKSALLMQIAAHVSITDPVIVHSFEMSTDEIETRLLAAISSVPTNLIIEGKGIHNKVSQAREDYASRKLYVSNCPNRNLSFVMSSVFELSKIVGRPGLVVIDYCQQVKPGGGNGGQQRVNEITDISAGLLQLSQQLKCNVLLGAQLNNEVLRRAYATQDEEGMMEYVPFISDIREGSSFAHDSSVVLMLVRPYVFDRKSDKTHTRFYCLKNRGGELWDQSVKWDGSRTQFYEEGTYESSVERSVNPGLHQRSRDSL